MDGIISTTCYNSKKVRKQLLAVAKMSQHEQYKYDMIDICI